MNLAIHPTLPVGGDVHLRGRFSHAALGRHFGRSGGARKCARCGGRPGDGRRRSCDRDRGQPLAQQPLRSLVQLVQLREHEILPLVQFVQERVL